LAGRYKVVTRERSKVARESFGELGSALDWLEARAGALQRTTDASPVSSLLGRDYEPVQQVAARLELRGPRVRGGVDVRGDGSAEAYTGRVRRSVVEQRAGESPYDALRRELRG
jgi:hypothetical protein